jgi:beta-fructofuranosidase
MTRLHYQHPATWFGDCMPIFANDAFQLFHQRDTRQPGPFGQPFGWALASTTDFLAYRDVGEVLHRGTDHEQDQFIFAGSVFEADGHFHAYYTGYNRDYPGVAKAAQVLMHAVSDDLEHWTKIPGELVTPEPGFDADNWRDPFVLRDEDADRWVMILGTRRDGDPIEVTGRTVWYTSPDLRQWTFQGDFWAPDLYTMHEMPDLFRMGDCWYLLTTEYSDRSKTVYRSSTSLTGPWSAPLDDAFDGRAYYAARSAADSTSRYLFGWVPSKEGETDLGGWQWGGTLVVHQLHQRPDRSLGVGIPDTVRSAFETGTPAIAEASLLSAADGQARLRLAPLPAGQPCLISLRVTARARSFAIRLFENDLGEAYAYTFRTAEQRLDFDTSPNYPWFRYDNRGLERPFTIDPGRTYDIEILVDDTIATLYVDGVALSVRMYDRPGPQLCVTVVDGSLTVHHAAVAVLST